MAASVETELGERLSESGSPPQQQEPEPASLTLTSAQRARAERQRLRARELRAARLPYATKGESKPASAVDSGGGFLLEPSAAAAVGAVAAAPAPLPHRSLQPECLECGTRFPASFLLDNFQHPVCDPCRDSEGAHALVPRTEAKSEFLLKDCDLDARPPPLACLRRRNPRRAAAHDMRLYLRAQLEERALLVWGSREALEQERERRAGARQRAAASRAQRDLRALRLQVRSGLYERAAPGHRHRWGPERGLGDDSYCRECELCGHTDTYEKM